MLNLGNRIVNNWLYPIHNGFVLIDTGYQHRFTHFKQELSKLGIDIGRIRYVFLTHAHDDHAGFLNELLAQSLHTQVIMSAKAPEVLRRGQNPFVGGCTGRLAFLFCQVMKLFGKGSHRFPPLRQEFEERCLLISEQNINELEAALCGKILCTPGHTSDSISLLLEDGALLCGDAAMNGLPSLHRITIWAENKAAFAHSWEIIIDEKPALIYPGHGKPFKYGELKENICRIQKVTQYPLTDNR